MKILVIQKKRIGDVLTSTILLESLRVKYPIAKLHYLVYENAVAVVLNNPFIDKIVVLDEKSRKEKWAFIKFLFSIRKEKYDIIVDAYGKPNSVIIGWFSGAKKTISFEKKYTKLLYSHTIQRNEKSFSEATTAIEHRMILLKPLGIDFKIVKPKIFLTAEEKTIAKEYLTQKGLNFAIPIVMISAIGSNPIKTYPLQNMAKTLDFICKNKNVQILFNYFPYQQDQAKELFDLCDNQTKIFFDVFEKDLRKFLAITNHCSALIGNEGGATNMAKAMNIPTFTIFSVGIDKNSWNAFENETTNISVHVHDYVDNKITDYKILADLFAPELFENRLLNFLNFNCK
jgi:heptosyltransferase II